MTSKPETKRAVAYLRVSSLSQVDGHSLDAQARLFNEICTKRGWTPGTVYREEGASAHSESTKKRPVFRQLMEDAKKGEFRHRCRPYPRSLVTQPPCHARIAGKPGDARRGVGLYPRNCHLPVPLASAVRKVPQPYSTPIEDAPRTMTRKTPM